MQSIGNATEATTEEDKTRRDLKLPDFPAFGVIKRAEHSSSNSLAGLTACSAAGFPRTSLAGEWYKPRQRSGSVLPLDSGCARVNQSGG